MRLQIRDWIFEIGYFDWRLLSWNLNEGKILGIRRRDIDLEIGILD